MQFTRRECVKVGQIQCGVIYSIFVFLLKDSRDCIYLTNLDQTCKTCTLVVDWIFDKRLQKLQT